MHFTDNMTLARTDGDGCYCKLISAETSTRKLQMVFKENTAIGANASAITAETTEQMEMLLMQD
jgi:hypothetical protein